MKEMKKYIKMVSCILGILLIMTILGIFSKHIFTSFADTPTKEVTVSGVTYEFEAEDIEEKKGFAHNIRVKSYSGTSKKLSFPKTVSIDGITYTVKGIGIGKESVLGGTTGWTEIVIPNSVMTISANAFKDCDTLKILTFTSSSSCVSIGSYAFYGCSALTNIRKASYNYTCTNVECSPSDGSTHSIEGCSGGISAHLNTLPPSITMIGDYAFYNCTSLVKLNLNTGVSNIGEHAFRGDIVEEGGNKIDKKPPLTTLTIKSNIENHNNAFKGHTGITTLKFDGNKCTTIYDSMFEGCTGLTKVTQSNYINKIGDRAFFGCTSLNKKKSITYAMNKELKVGKDAYRFGGYAEGITERPAIDITQGVEKADIDYYSNGIGKVTMNISSQSKQLTDPKDYIVCLDTTGSMYQEFRGGIVTIKNEDGTTKKTTKLQIAKDALLLLAETIYAENPNNRLAIVTQRGNAYLYMDFRDGSKIEEVRNAINEISPSNGKGSSKYGKKDAYYTSNGGTNYKAGLLTMSDVIMERQAERQRNVYGVFISDGFPTEPQGSLERSIIASSEHLKGVCDAVWAVGIAVQVDENPEPPDEGEGLNPDDDDGEFEEEVIDKSDPARYLKYIRSYWGKEALYHNFPAQEDLDKRFSEFMKSIVEVSTTALSDIQFKSKLNTDIWEFYTGADYQNSEGFNNENGQYATFRIPRVGKEGKQVSYYIKLKDNHREQEAEKLLVSNELTAEYTISGGVFNGEVCNKENGKNALYDKPLYLDWLINAENTNPGKLEIIKTGEGLIKVETKEDGTITPIYGEIGVKGAEFEIYAKEDIYIQENKLYAKDSLVKRIVTDEQGKAQLENLAIGKYYIKEVKAGEGFVLNKEIKEFEIVSQGSDKTIQKVEVKYKNQRQKVNLNGEQGLEIEKIADKKLYKPNEKITYTIKVTNTTQYDMKEIVVEETMIQGKFEDIVSDNIVKAGDRTIGIKELKAGESIELKFVANIENASEKEKVVNKIKAKGKVEIPDPQNPGKTIIKDIEGEDEEVVYISTKDLIIIKEALKKEYEIGETAQYVIKVINNGLTDIKDVLIEEKLLNGKFVYLEEANKNGVNVTLVDSQKVRISKIEPGKTVTLKYEYIVSKETKVAVNEEQNIILENKVTAKGKTEIKDPKDPNKTITKDVEDESTEQIEIQINSSKKGLGVIKKDLDTSKTLQGAIIGLYAGENIKGNGGEVLIPKDTLIEKSTTNAQGRAKYTVDLPIGKYYIKEIEAPKGYMLSEEKIEINAGYRGQEVDEINVSKILTNRKALVDFSIDKTISSISMNGENIKVSDGKLAKLEVKTSDIKKTEIIVKYSIKVRNKSDIEGKAKVLEIVPKGYEVVNAPEYWTTRADGLLETEVTLAGNESKELEITLRWINKEANLGSATNIAKLEMDDDTNTEDDDSQATLIISVKTGEIVSAIIIMMIVASLSICGGIITIVISKMGKGPDIKGINFLKK